MSAPTPVLTGELRPSGKLLTLYLVRSLFALVAFPFVFVPLYFRYHTLRYRLDDEGLSASWGILFRREVFLTYRRIQDIHVSAGIVQRWLGLATVEIQTASGSAHAELSIEGMENYLAIRDFLYARMRGAADESPSPPQTPAGPGTAEEVLVQIRDDLRRIRGALEAK